MYMYQFNTLYHTNMSNWRLMHMQDQLVSCNIYCNGIGVEGVVFKDGVTIS